MKEIGRDKLGVLSMNLPVETESNHDKPEL
jgi:hypothetical protein